MHRECFDPRPGRAGILSWMGVFALYVLGLGLFATGAWRLAFLAGRVAAEAQSIYGGFSLALMALGVLAIAVGWWVGRCARGLDGYCKAHNGTQRVLKYVAAILITLVLLFPVLWMLLSSLQPSYRLMQMPPTFAITGESGLGNYVKIFSKAEYVRYFINSFITAGSTVLTALVISVPAGFSFSRYRFRGRNAILTAILSVQMFPIVVILISLYTFYMKWNLLNTYAGVILADTTFAMPLAITLMKSFFDTLPRSLDESARIDGAGRMRTLFQILLPLTLPGLVAVGIYTFLSAWDDFLMAMTIMQSNAMKTLPVGLAQSFLGEYAHDYGALMAFSIAGSLPIVLMFVFFQKYMISGLTAGAVKG
jgi:multiple sugar transport system permease protein